MIVIGQMQQVLSCDLFISLEDTVLRASSHSGSDVMALNGRSRRHCGWK